MTPRPTTSSASTPRTQAHDGTFRHLTVKLNRNDVKLEYRPGYYAPADFQHPKTEDRELALTEQMRSDLPATDVALYLQALYFRATDNAVLRPGQPDRSGLADSLPQERRPRQGHTRHHRPGEERAGHRRRQRARHREACARRRAAGAAAETSSTRPASRSRRARTT